MAQFCITDPLFTIDDLRLAIVSGLSLSDGPFFPDLPELPTLPKPPIPTFSSAALELDMFIQSFMVNWQLLIPKIIIEAICDLLGLDFASILPPIPCLGLTFTDIFEKGGISRAIEEAQKRDILRCLGLPTPLLPNMQFPAFDLGQGILIAILDFIPTMLNKITELFQDVLTLIADLELPVPSLPSFPSIPTASELIRQFQPFPEFAKTIPTMPDITGLAALQRIKDMALNFILELLKPILEALEKLTIVLPFPVFPPLCFSFDVPKLDVSSFHTKTAGSTY